MLTHMDWSIFKSCYCKHYSIDILNFKVDGYCVKLNSDCLVDDCPLLMETFRSQESLSLMINETSEALKTLD
jgi:hypothetical protein